MPVHLVFGQQPTKFQGPTQHQRRQQQQQYFLRNTGPSIPTNPQDTTQGNLLLVDAYKVSSTNLNEDAPTLANFRLLSLPPEVIHCIMYDLSSIDVMNLLQALEQDLSYLPPKYWESKFRVHDEAGFARSICSSIYS